MLTLHEMKETCAVLTRQQQRDEIIKRVRAASTHAEALRIYLRNVDCAMKEANGEIKRLRTGTNGRHQRD